MNGHIVVFTTAGSKEEASKLSRGLVEEKLAADNAYLIYQNMLNGCQEALVRVRVRLEVTESDHSQ